MRGSRSSRLLRLKAFLLLGAFLTAGTSLPSLDAVVYHHQSADTQRGRVHLEPAGGCLDHAEHCVLGRTAPGSSAVVARAGKVTVVPVGRFLSERPATQRHLDAPRGTLPQPRAPPTLRYV